MVKKLIRCTQCNRIIPGLEAFGDFGEPSSLPGVEWSSEDLQEQKEFFSHHYGHPLEELSVDPETYVSDKPSFEPMKVAYFEATNGEEKFLIRRLRERLDRPASYELIPGRIQVSEVSLEIQEKDLLRQISHQNGSLPLPPEKIKKFVDAFRDEVKKIPPEKFAEEMEMVQQGETPLLAFGSLSEAHWERILQRCERDFEPSELEWIEKFIRENQQPGDVLALQIKRKVSICLS